MALYLDLRRSVDRLGHIVGLLGGCIFGQSQMMLTRCDGSLGLVATSHGRDTVVEAGHLRLQVHFLHLGVLKSAQSLALAWADMLACSSDVGCSNFDLLSLSEIVAKVLEMRL